MKAFYTCLALVGFYLIFDSLILPGGSHPPDMGRLLSSNQESWLIKSTSPDGKLDGIPEADVKIYLLGSLWHARYLEQYARTAWLFTGVALLACGYIGWRREKHFAKLAVERHVTD